MQGLMQEMPLTVGGIFRRAETLWPTKQVVTAGPSGLERTTYGDWAERTRRLGQRPGRPRGLPRRPGRHLRLEQRSPPRALLRGAVHRTGAAHPQHPALRRPARLHRQSRRGRGHLRRPQPAPDPVAPHRRLQDRPARGRDGRLRRPARTRPRSPTTLASSTTRNWWRRATTPPLRHRHRREHGGVDVLHERDHR